VVSCDVWPYSQGERWTGNVISFVSLVWACLLRQSIGLLGAATAFILLSGSLLGDRSMRPARFRRLLAGGVLLWLALGVPPALLTWRNIIFRIPETHTYHSHGIWHALYLGLGWVPNPWGIIWDDRYGIQVAKSINPQVAYGTYDYFNIMKGLYLQLLMKAPWAVLNVYGQKFLQVWNFPLFIMGIRISRWFLVLTGLAAVLFKKAERETQYPLRMILSLGLLYLIFGIQGVLAIPTGTHLYPLKFCVLLMMAVWADYARILWRVNRMRGARLNDGDTAWQRPDSEGGSGQANVNP
jgi:hypothetical protein